LIKPKEEVKVATLTRDHLYIGGEWVASAGDDGLDVINPATEELIATVPQATRADVTRAIRAARVAFDEGPWPLMSARERGPVLARFADVMERRMEELIDLNIREAGSTRALAQSVQVAVPLQHFRDTAERVLSTFPFEEAMLPWVGQGIGQGVVVREPIGVAALISAYNFPLFLNLFKLAPALAAGCTCVLKPSPYTPLEALILGEFAEEAGLPPGVLNIVTGDVDAGQELTTSPEVDVVSFTGSDTVGRRVYSQAAAGLKKVVLELGGKSANVITEDTDLSKVVPSVVQGMVVHCGQGCGLLTRTLVHESLHDDLVTAVRDALRLVTVGDPTDPGTVMGPLIREAQRERVEALIRSGVEEGAEIVFGGHRPSELKHGFFLEPTLFTGVDNSMSIAQREFFGPVGIVIPFRDDDEAIRLANESDFGLGGGVWAQDAARAYALARRLRTGYVTVNGGGGGLSPHGPFGGYKGSGLGREWGHHGMSEFLQHKTIAWGVAGG
jgi:acyl-CoA reductase-like NAD-dependent aldehyde dehydrogenase